jgi:thiamine-phosphate pyrophosphorylase
LITDRNAFHRPLHEVAEFAEEAKIDYFQLREKNLTSRELLDHAKHLGSILVHTKLIINGHLDVAIASGADGVHLQKNSVPIEVVRRRFPDLIVGYSAHSPEELQEARLQGASYAFLSPLFAPRSKQSDLKPIGIPQFKEWITRCNIPVFALGGINETNLREVEQTGCAGVAAISLFVNRIWPQ